MDINAHINSLKNLYGRMEYTGISPMGKPIIEYILPVGAHYKYDSIRASFEQAVNATGMFQIKVVTYNTHTCEYGLVCI